MIVKLLVAFCVLVSGITAQLLVTNQCLDRYLQIVPNYNSIGILYSLTWFQQTELGENIAKEVLCMYNGVINMNEMEFAQFMVQPYPTQELASQVLLREIVRFYAADARLIFDKISNGAYNANAYTTALLALILAREEFARPISKISFLRAADLCAPNPDVEAWLIERELLEEEISDEDDEEVARTDKDNLDVTLPLTWLEGIDFHFQRSNENLKALMEGPLAWDVNIKFGAAHVYNFVFLVDQLMRSSTDDPDFNSNYIFEFEVYGTLFDLQLAANYQDSYIDVDPIISLSEFAEWVADHYYTPEPLTSPTWDSAAIQTHWDTQYIFV